jgi:hypothetical protein
MIYIHQCFLNSNITSRYPVWVETEVAHVENKGKKGKDERNIQDARKEDTNDQEDAGAYGKNDDRGIKAQLAHRWLGRDHNAIWPTCRYHPFRC